MKYHVLLTISAIIIYKLYDSSLFCTLFYTFVSYILNFDHNVDQVHNYHGEIEVYKNITFTHKFELVTQTFHGDPANTTYHYVECGKYGNEPIVFFHGLFESWKVWQDVMIPFCENYYVVSFDLEGMGQSLTYNLEKYIYKNDSRRYLASLELQALKQIGIEQFNLVNTDISFWFNLNILEQPNTILRYAKFQSTVGQEISGRIPQGHIIRAIPYIVEQVVNTNPYALVRVAYGKTLFNTRGLSSNKRISREISDDKFNEIILKQTSKQTGTPWVWSYYYGLSMPSQVELQRNIFTKYNRPIYMLQGTSDKGQPVYLFDGTANTTIIETSTNMFNNWYKYNSTHDILTKRSENNKQIGMSPLDFFPNSPWKKFEFVDNVGHFLHLEAPEKCISTLKELLSINI